MLLKTKPLWGLVLPFGFFQLAVLAGGPIAAAWAVRHLRIEGRTPLQALSGWLSFAGRAICRARSPTSGQPRGRGVVSSERRPVFEGANCEV